MDVSRRSFFRSGPLEMLRAVVSGAEAQRRRSEPEALPRFLRPPGALPEAQFLTTCTRCDDCVKVCPKWAIRKAGVELGAGIEGTPMILPETNPCWLCKDLPCISACEAGALQPVEGPEAVRMGTVHVDVGRCYAAAGSICETCQERCPVRPRVVKVSFGQAPNVDVERCTGCGVCAYLCPADAMQIRAV